MGREQRILIVEDEQVIATAIRDRLENEGYQVQVAPDGDTGYAYATNGSVDLIILGLALPGRNGLEVCSELRKAGVDVPVLMLTGRGQAPAKVVSPRMGADDQLAKPFEMVELVSRVQTLLQRGRAHRKPASGRVPVGPFTFDLHRQQLVRGGRETALSTQEFKLLKYLYEHRGEVVDRDELLSAVWGYDESVYTRTVDVHVAWLRRKLDDRHRQSIIVTVRGRGYKLVSE